MRKLKLFLSLLMVMLLSVGNVWADYVKVTSTADITSGDYLIVYETGNVAFDGSLETLDAVSDVVNVTISEGTIASTDEIDAAVFTIDVTAGTVRSASGKYIGVSGNSNGLKTAEDAATYTNTFSIGNDGNAVIKANFDGSNMTLRFNKASNQNRFRYYKNAGQEAIQLYKKEDAAPAKPAVTVDSEITGGSVSVTGADDLGAVEPETELTVTATPGEGYKLPATIIFKDADGNTIANPEDELTYLESDSKNGGEFLMPNYNITVSASFTAKAVSAVTITNPEHGIITVTGAEDLSSVMEGTELTVSGESTSEAYSFGTISATTASNVPVAITNGKLIMPAEAITVTANETKRNEVHTAVVVLNSADEEIETPAGITATVNGGTVAYLDNGVTVNLVATPIAGYNFNGWKVTGEGNIIDKYTAESTTGTVYADGTFTAYFKATSTPQIEVTPSSLYFDAVAPDSEVEQTLTITGANITGNVTLALDAEMADAFTLSATSFTAEEVMAQGGVTVTVTPKTNTIGTFENEITISSEGVTSEKVALYIKVNKRTPDLAWKLNNEVITEESDPVVVYIGEENTFPTLYNPHNLAVEYWSNVPGIADISTDGAITLTQPSNTQTPVIHAEFAETDEYSAADVTYLLKVQQRYTAKWYVNGVELTESTQTAVAGTDLEFPSNPTKLSDDCEEMVFKGWAEAAIDGKQDDAPTYTELTAMPADGVNFYAVFATPGVETVPGDPEWVATAYADIATNDVVVITSKVGEKVYAMSNNNGTGSAPTASEVTVANSKLSAAPATTLQWDVTKDGDNATFYVHGSTTSWLYATNTNNGVRVGDNTSTTFSIKDDYLYHNGQSRYLGVYNSQDWRCYTTINTNIKDQTLAFYKQVAGTKEVEVYTDFLTTCPSCSKVTLEATEAANGTVELSSYLVKTCEDAEVTVTTTPATGYELSNIAISELSGASISGNTISLAAETAGELTVTATFSAINYTVTMEQTGGASATLTGATDEAHYNGTINITAEDKDGYIFNGWTSDPVVTFEDNEALETSFSMPNSDVTITASYTKILTVAEAIALVDADKEATHAGTYVSGIISNVESYSSNTINYWISDDGQTDALQAYKGKGLNNANFTAKSDLNVGDKVVIYGELIWYKNGSKYEMNSGNYLYSRVAIEETPTSIAISGTPNVTKYAEGQTFDPTGLVVTATYNTGYQAVVTSGLEWSNDLTDGKVMADGTVKVTAKLGEVVSEAYDVEVELAEQAPAFSVEAGRYTSAQTVALTAAEGAKIYYTLDESDPTNASTLYENPIELNTRQVYTIKAIAIGVKGESQIVSAVYNINLPYTFAELVAADLPSGSEDIVVTVDNNISEIPTSTTYGVFVDQKDKTGSKDVEIYFNNHAIPSSWKVGGHLSGTVTGTWTLYEGATSSIWEIVPESSFEWTELSYTKPKAPISWPSATASVYTAGKSNTWQKLNNEAGVSVTYSCDDAGVVTIDPSTGYITIVKAGVTVITASTDGNDDYSANVAEYTLTVVGPKSLTIEGSLVNDEYEAGQSFNRTGLSATVTYTDDETWDATSAAEWSFDPATITEDADVTVTATWNALNANKVVAVTVNKHAVSFTAAPANGTVVVATDAKGLSPITTGDKFVKGTVLYVIATPEETFKVNERVAISGGSSDILVKDGNDYKFTVGTEDVEVFVSFTASGTAVDNTEVGEKVVKSMENGVLIIRRGDKTYNGQGQLVK